MDETNRQIINSNTEIRWFNGSPLIICCANLYKDDSSDELFANIKFMNIQPEALQNVTVDIICYGIIRNEIARIENYTFENIHAERNICFGSTDFIPIENSETISIDVILKNAVDSDGEKWTNENSVPFNITIQQNSISSYMGRYFGDFSDLWREKGLAKDKLLYAPYIGNEYWLCVCGTFNWYVEENCCNCGVELEWLTENTDISNMHRKDNFLVQHNEKTKYSMPESENNEIEQQDAQITEKAEDIRPPKNKKHLFSSGKIKITAFSVVLAILAVLTLCTYYFLIPARDYYNATALISEGKYDQAIDELSKLNGYGDSQQEIIRAKYLKAETLMNNGEYLNAAGIFSQINYNDSSEKYFEAMYKYATLLYSQEDYINSLKTFINLADYNDSAKQASKAEAAAMNNASKLYENKAYSEASELFLEIYDITKNEDALEQSHAASLSQANYLYETNKYVEALKIYDSLSGYNHIDLTLKKLDSLKKILSTSIYINESSSVWENTTMQCINCHSPTLTYQFIFNDNGTYTFYRYCTNHSQKDDYEFLKGQYKIEDDVIYNLKHNGGSTEWVKFADIENISSSNSVQGKNAKLVITNPFDKKGSSLSLYGNIIGEDSSLI